MRTFGGENIGRPDNEAKYTVEDVSKFLLKNGVQIESFKPESLLVFTNSKAIVEAEDSPVSAVPSPKLKEFLRKKAKEKPFSTEKVKEIEAKIAE